MGYAKYISIYRLPQGNEEGETYDAGLERRLDLLLREAPPVDLLKERMALDHLCAVHAQTLRWVAR